MTSCQNLVCFSFLSAELTLTSRGFWWLVHFFSRKLKKLFRKLKDETELGETDSAHSKHPEQWDLDYSLEPYTGLTPEYMEMSKTSCSFLLRRADLDKGLGKWMWQPLLLPGLHGYTMSLSVPHENWERWGRKSPGMRPRSNSYLQVDIRMMSSSLELLI